MQTHSGQEHTVANTHSHLHKQMNNIVGATVPKNDAKISQSKFQFVHFDLRARATWIQAHQQVSRFNEF